MFPLDRKHICLPEGLGEAMCDEKCWLKQQKQQSTARAKESLLICSHQNFYGVRIGKDVKSERFQDQETDKTRMSMFWGENLE